MTEKELEMYLFKYVRITCVDGDTLEGYIYYFADADENESGEANITLENEKRLKRDVVVSLSEIESIEVMDGEE